MKNYDLNRLLDAFNVNKTIKFVIRPCPTGYVLYLNHYSEGKMQRISTKLKLTGTNKEYDLSVLQKASIERDEKELAILTGSITTIKKDQQTLIDYVNELAKTHQKFNFYVMACTLLIRYLKQDKKVTDITERDIEGFIKNHPAGNTTKHHYLFSIKHVLNLAVKEGIIIKNPASELKMRCDVAKREFLTTDELRLLLLQGSCSNEVVKQAFLFSCFTGLRRTDLYNLKWSDIREGYLYIRQHKTKELVRMKLNGTAIGILDKLDRSTNTIFHLPTYKYIRSNLKQLFESVNITKHLTLHCARHTFATLLLTYDTDIFTVSKLMGHTDVGTTLLYAKLIDKKKDDAIDKLPIIN